MEKKQSNPMAEAAAQFKKGEKAIKTGLFNWSPNFLEGAMFYEAAAKLYKQAGDKEQAKQAFLKYSMCSEKINEHYGAAEGLAEAAFLESDKKKSVELLQAA